MFKGEYITAVIPAKGNSTGVPKKNLRLLLGKPVIMYTIEAAKKSKYIDNICVATNSDEIASLAMESRVDFIRDPIEPVWNSFLDTIFEYNIRSLEEKGEKTDIAILLQPTSPLRDDNDVNAAIEKFYSENADSLLSVVNSHDFLWKNGENGAYPLNYDPSKRPVRQEMKQFNENGAIYIIKKDLLYKNHCRLGGKIALYVMPDFKAIQIDNEIDFKMIEKIMEAEKENGEDN